jgi:uncharacterized protein
VKPADHPDFFRLPPPLGASRESTIRLDRHGTFWHDGEKIERVDLSQAFARWVARHPDDRRFILQNGYDWVYLTVEDAPYFVRAVEMTSHGLELRLSDGTTEPLNAEGLASDAAGALYVRVKLGLEWAAWTRSAQLALAPFLVELDGQPAMQGPEGPVLLQVRSR